jgi:hypothetical protein
MGGYKIILKMNNIHYKKEKIFGNIFRRYLDGREGCAKRGGVKVFNYAAVFKTFF